MVWSAGAILTAAQLNTYLPQAYSTWTPTITASAGTFTTTSAAGRYIQFGKMIHWSATITVTTVGTATGYLQFTLPVAAVATTGAVGFGHTTSPASALFSQAFLGGTTTLVRVSKVDDSSVIGAGFVTRLSGTYEAA